MCTFIYSGAVRDSLTYSPCGKYLLYPLGSFVVIKNVKTGIEAFFDGHTREISCLSISNDGLRMASGQMNIPGVKVSYYALEHLRIVWKYLLLQYDTVLYDIFTLLCISKIHFSIEIYIRLI